MSRRSSKPLPDIFEGYKILTVDETPCVVISSVLYKDREDIKGSVFTAERLMNFIRNDVGLSPRIAVLALWELSERFNNAATIQKLMAERGFAVGKIDTASLWRSNPS